MSEKDLYQQLADSVMTPDSKIIARLWEISANREEAELLLAMPGQVGELSKKIGKSEEETQRLLDGLFIKGVAFKSRKTAPPTYRKSREVTQFHDGSILWPDAPQELYDLWVEYTDKEFPEFAKKVGELLPKAPSRVIPVNTAIEAKQQILAAEDAYKLVEDAEKLSVVPCTCRLIAKRCDNPVDVCIQLNRAAEYSLERGTGREITADEAKDMLRLCEEKGLIHMTMRAPGSTRVILICNCCSCCCIQMPSVIKYGAKFLDPSRYQVTINEEACTGCDDCIDRCMFGALSISDDVAQVDSDKCFGCGVCCVICPTEAMKLKEVRPPEFI